MKPIQDASESYEVDRRDVHAERPGFRISELQISPTQAVPWHVHTKIQDTFYVLEGSIRLTLRKPDETLVLGPGATFTVAPLRPHHVSNAGEESATFLVLQGIGTYDYLEVKGPSGGIKSGDG